MRQYEIVLDGELATDLSDALGPLSRREEGGTTILTVPLSEPAALERVLSLLESLSIGVTAVRQVDGPASLPADRG
jgi:hypothetical protein